ncbi:hypothetical protein GT031_13395 [Streptomyces sp. SID2888]|nr:hypothetical protein [Streptomyces sp. SID2888]
MRHVTEAAVLAERLGSNPERFIPARPGSQGGHQPSGLVTDAENGARAGTAVCGRPALDVQRQQFTYPAGAVQVGWWPRAA